MTHLEAAGGSRDLREGQEGVATAKVVGLTDTIWNVAAFQVMEWYRLSTGEIADYIRSDFDELESDSTC